MAGEIPNNVSQEKHSPVPKSFVFVLIFLVLIFGALNYFNIFSISKLWPIQKSKSISTIEKNNSPSTPFKLSCPTIKEFCKKGQGIVKDQYVGLGYKLSSGSAIFAAFDGNLTATFSAYPIEVNGKTTQQKFKILYLDNPSLNLRARYFFRGKDKDIKTGKISKGEQIAISNGKPIVIYDNSSLVFSLIQTYQKTNTPVILNNENFE